MGLSTDASLTGNLLVEHRPNSCLISCASANSPTCAKSCRFDADRFLCLPFRRISPTFPLMLNRLLPPSPVALCGLAAWATQCTLGAAGVVPLVTLRVGNPSDFARSDELVNLPLGDLGTTPGEALALVARRGGEALPLQVWDENGDGTADTVTLLLDLAAAEVAEVALALEPEAKLAFPSRVQAEMSERVGGEWEGHVYKGGEFRNVATLTPPPQHTDHSFYLRYEGPGWESDKIGYRFYLDWRNGFDIFGKTTPELVLQNVGADGFESYHEMSDWGMDILKVGDAVGVGGFGFWNGEAVERVSELDGWTSRVVSNGPLWAQIETLYRGWRIDGRVVDLVARLRIGAGSRITWVDLEPRSPLGPLAAGLVKHPGTEVMPGPTEGPAVNWSYLATYGAQTLHGDDLLGMAVLFRRDQFDGFREDALNQVVAFRSDERTISYGFLAAWDQEPGGIQSRAAFAAYLEETVERLDHPVRIEVLSPAVTQATPACGGDRRGADGGLSLDRICPVGGHGFGGDRSSPSSINGLVVVDDPSGTGPVNLARVEGQGAGAPRPLPDPAQPLNGEF